MKSTLYIILLLSGFIATRAGAQPQVLEAEGVVHLRAAHIADSLVDLSTVPWRFRDGDDPAWRDADYDDSNWAWTATDFQPKNRTTDVWQGLGWFRLHLQVDSSMQNTLLGLYTYQTGALEIFLDGKYVGGFGTIGASAEEDETYIPLGLPLILDLDAGEKHLLAVRFANRSLSQWEVNKYRTQLFLPPGFALVIGPHKDMVHSYVFEKSALYTDALISGLLVAILILHLLLYLFDRRDRTNLYYALALVFLVIGNFCAQAMDYRVLLVSGAWSGALLNEIGNQTFVLFTLLLLATLYSLFAPRLLRWLWGGLVLWVALGALWYGMGLSLEFPAFPLPGLVLLLEAVRVTVYAVYKRQEGAWILGAAMVFTLGIVLFIFLTGSGLPPTNARLVLQEAPDLITRRGYLSLLFFAPIPLSMSVLLAQRFARRSRRLERELERVEELSAQTLAQEREKQALITHQKERLEAEVDERTLALKQSLADLKATQQQLVHAEKMASLGALTAGIAHEIKNPLNFVNNFASLSRELVEELEEETDLDEVQAILSDLKLNAEKIEAHGKRADSIVRSMMQHVRAGSGKREAVDLNKLVNDYVDLASKGKRTQVPDFNVELVRDYDEEVGEVEVVPQEVGRVLLNLLGNAFDAVAERRAQSGEGYAPTVTVRTRRVDGQVEIRVKDNGPGIAEDVYEKIFEPFFTTKPTGSGTGLGLSLSYDIVTQGHGGTLTVESEPEQGAAFVMRLPAGEGEQV